MTVYIVTIDEVYPDALGDLHTNRCIIPCASKEVALKEVHYRLGSNTWLLKDLFNNYNEENLDKLGDTDTIKNGNITSIGELNSEYALYTFNRRSYNAVYLFKLWKKSNYINSHIEIRILELELRE